MNKIERAIINKELIPSKKYKGVFFNTKNDKWACIIPQTIIVENDMCYEVYGDTVTVAHGKGVVGGFVYIDGTLSTTLSQH